MQDIKYRDVKAYYRTNSADTAGGPEVEMDGRRERMSHDVNEGRGRETERERLKKKRVMREGEMRRDQLTRREQDVTGEDGK